MKYSRIFPFLGLVLCLLALRPSGLEAQGVEGRVTWSGGEPVAGATTTLLDVGFQSVGESVTDAEGRYRLTAPSAGEYIVVVEVEGYPSQMSNPISVAETGTVALDVVVADQRVGEANLSVADTLSDADLVAAALAETCRGQFVSALHGILFGAVRDAATGTPIHGATTVVWREDPYAMVPGAARLETQTDATGIYVICNASAGVELRIRANAEGTEGTRVTERLRAGTMLRVDLEIPLHDPDVPGNILGRVQDQDWGQVIRGVEVGIKDTDFRAETDARGYFRIRDIPWGQYTLVFDHPSYGHSEQTLSVIGGRSHDLEVHLPPEAIEMAPIVVKVRPRRWFGDMEGLHDRIESGVGHIMTRTQIDERQPLHLGDMLRAVPGVDVVQRGSSLSGGFEVSMRNAQNMMGQICPPAVWIDGQKWRDPASAYTEIQGNDLEVVEVYKGPAEVPGEFLDSAASCGAVIVWTRRGRTFGG